MKGLKMAYQINTVRGYDFYECASALQKAIRRNRPDIAGFFAFELYHSGFAKYVWKRLLTISAEDCHGIITREILALKESWEYFNKATPKSVRPKGRLFVSKAVLILCYVKKCRDADHLHSFIYDKRKIDESKFKEFLEVSIKKEPIPVPEFALDCHTKRGRMKGKTKDGFWQTERDALKPRQAGLFDNVIV